LLSYYYYHISRTIAKTDRGKNFYYYNFQKINPLLR